MPTAIHKSVYLTVYKNELDGGIILTGIDGTRVKVFASDKDIRITAIEGEVVVQATILQSLPCISIRPIKERK